MTEALRYIKAELGRGNSQFFVPARILREEDRPLLHRYALVFRGEYLPKIACPECGELVEVRRGVGETGEPHYSALCLHCEVLEERSIAPEEVELLAFQIRAFRQYVSNPKETGEYVAEAEACLPVQAVGESAAVPDSQAQAPTNRRNAQSLHSSKFAGSQYCKIRISSEGQRIRFGQDKVWLKFKGARQWQIIDALFATWKDGFEKKVNIGKKNEIEKIFNSRAGRYLMKFIHFETREEAQLTKARGNCQYTGNARFESKLIYPEYHKRVP